MLDTYLEKNIQKKIHIVSIFQLKKVISLKDLSEMSKISQSSLIPLIDELNFELEGLAEIKKASPDYELVIFDGVSYFEVFHVIYQTSNILHCLKFMITNDDCISFNEFAEDNFLTRPSAYRIRQTCVTYLQDIGLSVQKNRVVGAEYRIRFLIALLRYKCGISCYDIDNDSVVAAREFVLATNDKINMEFLEKTSSEYGYFEHLLILSWKREKYPVDFGKSEDLEILKQLFIYPDIKKHLQETIEKKLNITFTDADYDYIFLVYCCTNSCVLADKWSPEDIALVGALVFSNDKFNDLVSLFSKEISAPIWASHAFKAIMIYFFKKCLFDLHCIIPDKHYYLDMQNDPFKKWVLQYVSKVLAEWQKRNNIPYTIDRGHLQYLTIQITSIAQQFMRPVQIFVISDLIAEIEVMELYLSRAFSDRRISIKPVLFNAEDLSFFSSAQNSVFITKNVFYPALSAFDIPESSVIVPVNIEINELDKNAIAGSIRQCEKNIFRELISD